MPLPPPPLVHLLTLGDTLSGKSCLIKRYCEGRFVPRYIATIGVDYGARRVRLGPAGREVRLQFFDTSGLPAYAEVRSEFEREAHAVLLVFDVGSHASFEGLPRWLKELQEHGGGGTQVAVAVVGSKVRGGRVVARVAASG